MNLHILGRCNCLNEQIPIISLLLILCMLYIIQYQFLLAKVGTEGFFPPRLCTFTPILPPCSCIGRVWYAVWSLLVGPTCTGLIWVAGKVGWMKLWVGTQGKPIWCWGLMKGGRLGLKGRVVAGSEGRRNLGAPVLLLTEVVRGLKVAGRGRGRLLMEWKRALSLARWLWLQLAGGSPQTSTSMQLLRLISDSSSMSACSCSLSSAILSLISSISRFWSEGSCCLRRLMSVLSLRFLLIHSFSSLTRSLMRSLRVSSCRFSSLSFSLRRASSRMISTSFSLLSFFSNSSKLSLRASCFSSPSSSYSRFSNSSRYGLSFSFSSCTLTAQSFSDGTRFDSLGFVATRCEILRLRGWLSSFIVRFFSPCPPSSTATVDSMDTLFPWCLPLLLSGVVLFGSLPLSCPCSSPSRREYFIRLMRQSTLWNLYLLGIIMVRGALLQLRLSLPNLMPTSLVDTPSTLRLCAQRSTSEAYRQHYPSYTPPPPLLLALFANTMQPLLLSRQACESTLDLRVTSSQKSCWSGGGESTEQAWKAYLPWHWPSFRMTQLKSRQETWQLLIGLASFSMSTQPVLWKASASSSRPWLRSKRARLQSSSYLRADQVKLLGVSSRQRRMRSSPQSLLIVPSTETRCRLRRAKAEEGSVLWQKRSLMGLNLPVSLKCSSTVFGDYEVAIIIVLQVEWRGRM